MAAKRKPYLAGWPNSNIPWIHWKMSCLGEKEILSFLYVQRWDRNLSSTDVAEDSTISHHWSSWWHLESWLHPHLQKQTILVSFAKVLHLGKEESWISPASFNLMHSICARMLKKLEKFFSNKNTFRHEMNKKLSTEKEKETHWWGDLRISVFRFLVLSKIERSSHCNQHRCSWGK